MTDSASDDKAVAIYHLVYADEGFEDAAGNLFEMVRNAARKYPGKPRHLYLDIEGHRNATGGFDADMTELQQEFILGVLAPYLSRVRIPLMCAERREPQRDDVPERLEIRPARDGG